MPQDKPSKPMSQEKVVKSKDVADRRLTEELDDTFPASDPPSSTQPGGGITGADDGKAEKIRTLAYSYWLEEGESHGQHEDHWRRAEKEVAASGKAKN